MERDRSFRNHHQPPFSFFCQSERVCPFPFSIKIVTITHWANPYVIILHCYCCCCCLAITISNNTYSIYIICTKFLLFLASSCERVTYEFNILPYPYNMHVRDWILVFVSIFVPPVAVWLKRGFFTKDFLINVLLFFFGFIPSLIHSLYIISKHPYTAQTLVTVANTNNHNHTIPSSSTHNTNTNTNTNTNDINVGRNINDYGSIV